MRRATSRLLLAVLLAVGGAALAEDETFLYFNSQPGDYILYGRELTLTPSDGAISTRRVDGGVLVGYTSGDSWWTLAFVPPAGTDLAPGAYEWTMSWREQSPTMPGLAVYGNGRHATRSSAASRSSKPSTTTQARSASSPSTTSSTASWRRRRSSAPCASTPAGPSARSSPSVRPGDTRATAKRRLSSSSSRSPLPRTSPSPFATRRWTARPRPESTTPQTTGMETFAVGETRKLLYVPLIGDVEEEPDETFVLSLSDAQGAPIAFSQGLGTIVSDDPCRSYLYFDDRLVEGRQFSVTPVDGNITVERVDGAIHADFDGFQDYLLRFGPPAGSTLTPGGYVKATRHPSLSPNTPGLDVTWHHTGWGDIGGQFVVLEAEYGVKARSSGSPRTGSCMAPRWLRLSSVPFGTGRACRAVLASSSVPPSPAKRTRARRRCASSSRCRNPRPSPSPCGTRPLYGTARAGTDYDSESGTVTFAPGQTAVPVTVTIHGDLAEQATSRSRCR